MSERSFCAIHGTYPQTGEPCWICVGPYKQKLEKQNEDSERLRKQRFDLQQRLDQSEFLYREAYKYLMNLLATVHRDGGHYATAHGLEDATEDAIKMVVKERTEADRVSGILNGKIVLELPQGDTRTARAVFREERGDELHLCIKIDESGPRRIDPCCIKCGSQNISMQYCNTYLDHSYGQKVEKHNGVEEVIHCHCRSCGYNWNELPLDTKKER